MNPLLTEPLLAPFRKSIIESAKPVAMIELYESEGTAPWQSNFAGKPYLPKGMAYPMHPKGYPLRLLIQINFAEMPPLPDFPIEGILQIFVDSRDDGCYGLFDEGHHHIIYHPEVLEDSSQLQANIETGEDFDYIKHISAMRFVPKLQYASGDERELGKIVDKNGNSLANNDNLRALYYQKTQSDGGNFISGYPYFNQYDPRFEWEGNLDYQYEGTELARMTTKYERFRESVLLLQLDGGDERFTEHGFSCNFFIHPDDLKNHDFSQVFGNLDAD